MESEFEKRLFGSPRNSPIKALTSPSTTPLKDGYGDRFVSMRSPRTAVARRGITFGWQDASSNAAAAVPTAAQSTASNKDGSENPSMETYKALLNQELSDAANIGTNGGVVREAASNNRVLMARETSSMFAFRSHRQSPHEYKSAPYMLSPISDESQRILSSPKRQVRKIPKLPYKVLDAPDLLDDFYLNLVDWSSRNTLSVGLGCCVYLWNAYTCQVTRLCDLSAESDSVSSVAWSEKGDLVAVGTHRCQVQIWDVNTTEKVRVLDGHSGRVGALAWNGDLLASGSRDRTIRLWDYRRPCGGSGGSTSVSGGTFTRPSSNQRLTNHRQEVCGLKWSPDRQHLASGGNDNKLLVWSTHSTQPLLTYNDHAAAVKAIAWSPHQHGLLASGGGTADRCIRFWNTLTSQPLSCIDTGSQVCNIAWSKHSNELVTTHGYSQNQILLWKYPALTQIGKLTGHSCRVLYLSVSPDGESIVTGAGDETLRFWHVFSKAKQAKTAHSQLGLFAGVR
ncbi:hypothetical protein BOX15_Mlig026154g1 [Macrostomum lignano]|uniref:Fizzy-related protein homolog n=2 Tax=Macrostomum lignano TaxID=282301 RepID=A0A1I8HPL4_9PLAT|nr:hypothetical protein BOX15_Mlig026154g1 [Macrostomum lignano]